MGPDLASLLDSKVSARCLAPVNGCLDSLNVVVGRRIVPAGLCAACPALRPSCLDVNGVLCGGGP